VVCAGVPFPLPSFLFFISILHVSHIHYQRLSAADFFTPDAIVFVAAAATPRCH